MGTIFDPKEIKAAGETLYIRPIGWSDDTNVEGAIPTIYETTCPTCSQRVEIYAIDIVDDTVISTECTAEGFDCPFNVKGDYFDAKEVEITDVSDEEVETDKELLEILDDNSTPSITVKHEGTEDNKTMTQQEVAKPGQKKKINENCPFQDPVEAGELTPA